MPSTVPTHHLSLVWINKLRKQTNYSLLLPNLWISVILLETLSIVNLSLYFGRISLDFLSRD